MATPTYRSINLTATLLGIDRRLCIVILIVTFLVFLLVSLGGLRSVVERGLLGDETRSRIGRDRSESPSATERVRPRQNNQQERRPLTHVFPQVVESASGCRFMRRANRLVAIHR